MNYVLILEMMFSTWRVERRSNSVLRHRHCLSTSSEGEWLYLIFSLRMSSVSWLRRLALGDALDEKDALSGASVECAHDGWWCTGSPEFAQKIEVPLGFLHQRCSVGGLADIQ